MSSRWVVNKKEVSPRGIVDGLQIKMRSTERVVDGMRRKCEVDEF